jgi:hypothetical protein
MFVLFYPFSILKIELSVIRLSVYPPTIIATSQVDASTEGKVVCIFCFLHPSSIQNPQQYCICYYSNRSRDSAELKLWSCTSTLYMCTACCAFTFSLRMRHSSSVWASCEVEFTFVCRRLKFKFTTCIKKGHRMKGSFRWPIGFGSVPKMNGSLRPDKL